MSTPPPNFPAGDSAAPAPLPPPRVPDHELIRRIGRGAYGEVWIARSVTGAYRAVKVVHRASFDHDRPFEREFEGIQKFEPISRGHESQVDILHVGRGNDCFYYVMELADDQATGGQINPESYAPRTLKSDLMFHGRLPFEECVRIGLALTTALENLHGHGLAHRDVKPSNIIFVNGVPNLAGIGLVAGVEATRSYVGTEGFAAPEGPGSAQADLYSLGKVLYEISTGKDRQDFPELPTQLRELPDREGLMELNAVITRACRHDPKDRYVSATAMRTDLELPQSGRSLARVHRLERKLRLVRRAGGVMTALAVVIAAGWFWQARQTRIVRDLGAEKSYLAEENRERLVRLDIANSVRLMYHDDFSGALLSLAEALPLVTNNPAEAAIHRIRIQQLLPHPASVATSEFSPDEHRVVTGGADGIVRVWDLARDEQPVAEFPQDSAVGRVRFTHDGRLLFVVQRSSLKQPDRVALLDAVTGRLVFTPISDLTCVALSPDDRWLAVARTNFAVQIIAADTGRIAAELVGHRAQVEMVSFSPDSSQIISASHDGTVRRWQVSSGQAIGEPLPHPQPVAQAIFSGDASRIVTATAAGELAPAVQIQTWDAATGLSSLQEKLNARHPRPGVAFFPR